jgi:hypothetical protein
MLLGCGYSQRGLGSQTQDPVGTPIVNSSGAVIATLGPNGTIVPISATNPAPAVQTGNAQRAAQVVQYGTPSTSPSACNYAGGYQPCYPPGYTTMECMLPSDCAAMMAGGGSTGSSTTGSSTAGSTAASATSNPSSTGSAGTSGSTSAAASSDIMLGSFDLTQNWMYLAVGAVALVAFIALQK